MLWLWCAGSSLRGSCCSAQALWCVGIDSCGSRALWCVGLVAAPNGGSSRYQGSIPCILHRWVDSLPLSHRETPPALYSGRFCRLVSLLLMLDNLLLQPSGHEVLLGLYFTLKQNLKLQIHFSQI